MSLSESSSSFLIPQKQSFLIPVAKRAKRDTDEDKVIVELPAHDVIKQSKKGGYQKMWLCIPTSVQEFPNKIDANFKEMCKFILQQREPPYNFIISLRAQKLPSTFKKFEYVKKVVAHKEEKKSLVELSKIYKVIYCDPILKGKRGNEVAKDDDVDDDDDEKNFYEKLCYETLDGCSLESTIQAKILEQKNFKKAKILSAHLKELRQLEVQSDETIFTEFCFQLMEGTPLLKIQEGCGPVSGVIFQRNFIKLCEFANNYDKLKEEEVYSKLCQEIRKGPCSFDEIEAKASNNLLESRIFYRNFQELNKIFEQTQQEILCHSLLEGKSIQELQKSIVQKQDRALSRLFIRSFKELQDFSDGILPSKKLKTEAIGDQLVEIKNFN